MKVWEGKQGAPTARKSLGSCKKSERDGRCMMGGSPTLLISWLMVGKGAKMHLAARVITSLMFHVIKKPLPRLNLRVRSLK